MSADEAAAQADALIAQHRAARSRTRSGSRMEPSSHAGSAGRRSEVVALLVLGIVTGLAWRSAPLLAIGLGIAAIAIAYRIVRALADRGAASGPQSR